MAAAPRGDRSGTWLVRSTSSSAGPAACALSGVGALGGQGGGSPCFHRESWGWGTGDQQTRSLCDNPGGAPEGSGSRALRGFELLLLPGLAGCGQDPALGPRHREAWAPGGWGGTPGRGPAGGLHPGFMRSTGPGA